MKKIIRMNNVYKSFGDKHVHKGVDLEIFEGERITILGGSGSGKSVLLKEINGLIKPDSGEVHVLDIEVSRMEDEELTEVRADIGMLFQGAALFDSLSVRENIAYSLMESNKFSREEIDKVVAKKLNLVGLPGIEDKMPSDLSGGMKKRVGIARALAKTPKILLYDEPTTGLDPPNINRINELIIEMNSQFGITSVIITHDIDSAFEVSDRVAFLHDGRIIFTGSVKEAKKTKNEILNDFINGVMREDIAV